MILSESFQWTGDVATYKTYKTSILWGQISLSNVCVNSQHRDDNFKYGWRRGLTRFEKKERHPETNQEWVAKQWVNTNE